MTAPLEGTSRHNNFDILRLSAAIMVVSSHSFAAVRENQPPSFLDPFGNAWSYLGVLIFFSISGYLIAQSWIRDPSPGRYLARRRLSPPPCHEDCCRGLSFLTSSFAQAAL